MCRKLKVDQQDSGQATTKQIPVDGEQFQACWPSDEPTYLRQIVHGVVEEDNDEEPATESIVPEEKVPVVDNYYEVELLECEQFRLKRQV